VRNAERGSLPRTLLRRLFGWGERCFAVIGLILTVYHTGFQLSPVVSPSMAPTLQGTSRQDADWLLIEKWTYRFRRPERWEVVSFHTDWGFQVAKRVVGLPGESVALTSGILHVNGVAAERPPALEAIDYLAYGNLHGNRSVDCGDGYYVLGDDSKDSEDSRFEGPVPTHRIEGRAWLIVWPLERFGRFG